jgi:flagellar hook assembly protein FlgD
VAVYPNPFRSATTVEFTPRAGAAPSTAAPARKFRVQDVRGRIVRSDSVPARGDGSASWRWDGTDQHGVRLAPGAYFVSDVQDGGRAARIVLDR